jgi:uncharacterized protein YaeQ
LALTSTIYRFELQVNDVDRGVYEHLAPRVACHPSETLAFMCTRVLAYALEHEEGIAFGGGVSTVEEPAVWVRHPDGRVAHWIDVGAPSAERLHRASKLAERVSIYAHKDPAALHRDAAKRGVHRADRIPVWTLPAPFVEALGATLDRSNAWEVLRSDRHLYVTVGGRTLDTVLEPRPLVAAP